MPTQDTSDRPKWIIDHPKEFIFDYIVNDKTLGHVWYRPMDLGYEIDHLEILKPHRGQGLGVELVHKFINFCLMKSQAQSFEIWLEVSHQNLAALKVYEKIGFHKVGHRPKYYSDGSDALLMTLKVPGSEM